MMELLYFILGIIFVQYIIPTLDSFIALLLTWIETKKAGLNEIINDANIKIRQASASAEEVPEMRQIGFYLPDETTEEEEEEE